MTVASALRAVLFDAGNTLLFLDYPRIAAGMSEHLGVPLTAEALRDAAGTAARAMERRGTDHERARAFLEALFLAVAVPEERLGEVRECLGRLHRERHLWAAVPEGTAAALARLRGAGLRLAVVSNSDGRVASALEAAGLRDCFEVVVDSALVGVEKPDPAIFHAALELLGVAPADALYVGDLYEVDVLGARAAGMEAVLVGAEPHPSGCWSVSSVAALVEELLSDSRGPLAKPHQGSL